MLDSVINTVMYLTVMAALAWLLGMQAAHLENEKAFNKAVLEHQAKVEELMDVAGALIPAM